MLVYLDYPLIVDQKYSRDVGTTVYMKDYVVPLPMKNQPLCFNTDLISGKMYMLVIPKRHKQTKRKLYSNYQTNYKTKF